MALPKLHGRHDEVVAEYIQADGNPYKACIATCAHALEAALGDQRLTPNKRYKLEGLVYYLTECDTTARVEPG